MSIGLYDADMITYHQTAPNLELMKIASYYKNKGEIVVLSPQFVPSQFSKYFYRKDYDDGIIQPDINKYKNIIIGGNSFSNNIYVPLQVDIESSIPDTYIYNKMESIYGTKKAFKKIYKTCLNYQHLRLSLDGKTIWEDFYKQLDQSKLKNYFFHDFNLTQIKDSNEIIKELVSKATRFQEGFIGTKFPIQIYNEEDMEKWKDFSYSYGFFNLNYYGLMSTDYFKHFLKTAPSQNSRQSIQYIVTYGFKNQQDFVENGVERMYDQYIIACTNRKKISLIYNDNFFEDDIWKDFFTLLKVFNDQICKMNRKIFDEGRETNSLFTFVRYLKEQTYDKVRQPISKRKAREIFEYMRVKNYSLFKKFYESYLTELL